MGLISERGMTAIFLTHPVNGWVKNLDSSTSMVQTFSLGLHVSDTLAVWRSYLEKMASYPLDKGWTRSAYGLADASLSVEQFNHSDVDLFKRHLLFRTTGLQHLASLFFTFRGEGAGYFPLKPLISLGYYGEGSPEGVYVKPEDRPAHGEYPHPLEDVVKAFLRGDETFVPPAQPFPGVEKKKAARARKTEEKAKEEPRKESDEEPRGDRGTLAKLTGGRLGA